MIRASKSLYELLNHPCNRSRKFRALIRIVWWKINQILFHVTAIVRLTSEAECICSPRSSYGGLVIYTRFPEYDEMKLVYRCLNRNHIFIDVGANIGVYSLIAGSKIRPPNGKVYAFEPTESSLYTLRKNIDLNNFRERVEVIPAIASDEDGIEKFSLCTEAEMNHIAHRREQDCDNIREMIAIKLDSFCLKKNLRYVDMVKIDVEGAEYKVLKGFESYLSRGKIGILIIEVNADARLFGIGELQVLSFLEEKQYELYRFNFDHILYRISQDSFHLRKPTNIIAAHPSSRTFFENFLT